MEEEEGRRLETTMGGRACRARQSEEEYKDSHFAAKYSYRASEYSSERCWICPIRFPFTKASNRSTTWSTGLSLHPRPNLPPTKAHIWMGPKFWSALGGPRLWELREGPRVHSLSLSTATAAAAARWEEGEGDRGGGGKRSHHGSDGEAQDLRGEGARRHRLLPHRRIRCASLSLSILPWPKP